MFATRTRRACSILVAVALTLGSFALLPATPAGAHKNGAGLLETSFDDDGKFTLDVNAADRLLATTIDPTGRLVSVGYGDDFNDNGAPADRDRWLMQRLAADGTRDLSFHTLGYFLGCQDSTTSPCSPSGTGWLTRYDSRATDISVDPVNGSYLVVGTDATQDGTAIDGKVIRVAPSNGAVLAPGTFALASGAAVNRVTAVAHLPGDQRMIVAGSTENADLGIVRLLGDLSVDPSFGVSGYASFDEFADGRTSDVAVTADGSIYVLGNSHREDVDLFETGFVAKFTSAGVLDSAYGTGGVSWFRFEADEDSVPDQFVVRPDGTIVVTGYSGHGATSKVGLAALTAGGQLDGTFGNGTGVVADALTADGSEGRGIGFRGTSIMVGVTGHSSLGATGTGAQFAIARYDERGVRDVDFGAAMGHVTVSVGADPSRDTVRDIAVKPDGSVYLVGHTFADLAITLHAAGDSPDSIVDGDIETFSGGIGLGTALDIGLSPVGVAVNDHYLFVSSHRELVRKVDLNSGEMSLVAGDATRAPFAPGGLGAETPFTLPEGVDVDPAGNVYVASQVTNSILKITPAGVVSRFAGTGVAGSSGNGGPATAATLRQPQDVVFDDASGEVFIADSDNHQVRKVGTNGVISLVAGLPGATPGDGGPGPATSSALNGPNGIDVDGGNVYIADTFNNKVKVVDTDGEVALVAGTGATTPLNDGGPGTSANLNLPNDVLAIPGAILISDSFHGRVRSVDTTTSIITTFAGGGLNDNDGIAPTTARLLRPLRLARQANGDIFIADDLGLRVRKISGGLISTIAGNRTRARSSITAGQFAQVDGPNGVRAIGDYIYIADTQGGTVHRQHTSTYEIEHVAGHGSFTAVLGDGGPATAATLLSPIDVVADSGGNIYVSSIGNQRIRRIDGGGVITTYAGVGTVGNDPDGTHRTAVHLNSAQGLAIDPSNNLYYADSSAHLVRRIDAVSGTVTTVAGTGAFGYNGDGIPATSAQLNSPRRLAIGPDGALYIADTLNDRVRRVDLVSNTITTVAGNGAPGDGSDVGPALSTTVSPTGLAFDEAGDLFIADTPVVRKLHNGAITNAVGTPGTSGSGFGGDRGPATSAKLGILGGLTVHDHDLFVGDTTNNRIRKIMNIGGFAPPAGGRAPDLARSSSPAIATATTTSTSPTPTAPTRST